MTSLTDRFYRLSDRLGFQDRSAFRLIAVSLIAGIAVRYVLGFLFTYAMDTDYWVIVNNNITTGNGLFEMPGYYYTPVWGYFLAFLNPICNVLGITTGVMTPEYVLPEYGSAYHALIPTLAYAMMIKTALIAFDVLAGYFIYMIARDIGADERRASVAFAVWFLCPLTVLVSSCRMMFENLEMLFLLASFHMMLTRRPWAAGAMIALSLLTKPYGVFMAVMMIGFSYAQDRDIRYTGRFVLATFLTGVLVMLPTLLANNLDMAFYWLTDRTGSGTMADAEYSGILGLVPTLLVLSLAASAIIAYKGVDDPRKILFLALFFQVGMLSTPGNIQYYLIYLPYLAILGDRYWLPVLIPMSAMLFMGLVTEPVFNSMIFLGSGLPGGGIVSSFAEWALSLDEGALQLAYRLIKQATTVMIAFTPIAVFVHNAHRGRTDADAC